jgi:predicted acetyltransferase
VGERGNHLREVRHRQFPSFEAGVSNGRLEVVEAIGTTPQATAETWRFLLDVDWYATLEASLLPVDHPLFLLLSNPRRLRYRMGDGLWARLVDVGAALSGRAYAGDGSFVFEVRDGAVERADTIFGWCPLPWCPEIF